jgi:8-oxo-dGTP pyrophosphatase MutT (NUDIX family)
MRVTFDPDASDELDRIFARIADDNPRAALNMVRRIRAKVLQLETPEHFKNAFAGASLMSAPNIGAPKTGATKAGAGELGRIAESALRRVLHLYWRMSRGLTLGVRGLVIDGGRRVFLVKHTYVSGWHLPGGGVEPGETLLEALARELKEEGNIEILATPVLHGMFFNSRVSRRDHVALFVVEHFRQPAPPLPGREIMAHGFFALEDLPGDTTAATRARIAEVMMGAPVSPRW